MGKVVPERGAMDSECVAVGSGTTANTRTRRSQPVQVEKMAGARVEAMSPSVCAPLLRQTDSVAGKEAVDVEADEEAGAVVDKAVAESKGGGKAGNVEAVEPRVVEGVVEGIRCAAAGSFSWTGRLQIEGRALANP